ncbi:gliding motility-associated-like protein [Chitinophaga skermanii]|uniref:Gliding motility-associated-like protein n=2 Tax=Chitinophaga skermanii TaxID=331697 RepID=A0A327Q1V9_9BACT|nr:gliding motility-associated-like protein [Chitinophaga skermanii]
MLVIILCYCCSIATAYHIIGGEVYYETLGFNALTNNYRYKITMKLYRDGDFVCGTRQGCLDIFENPVPLYIFRGSDGSLARGPILFTITDRQPLRDTLKNPCLAPQTIYLEVAYYTEVVELPAISGGYYVTYQRCCRGENLTNIEASETEGSNYFAFIPGTESRPGNNSAVFVKDEALVICAGLPLQYTYTARDADGDSLVYYLCDAKTGGTDRRSDAQTVNPPPFNRNVRYLDPYNGSNPMGGNPRISISNQGIITGTPERSGRYVVSVCVSEYDRTTKKLIATHHKDILITVFNCNTRITAQINNVLQNCLDTSSFAVPIANYSTAGFTSTFHWTFSDGTDTITNSKNLFYKNFSDTGYYTYKLVVNKGLPCTDSIEGKIFNYPGLRAGFFVTGACAEKPITFSDTSSYRYGTITNTSWNLGNDPPSIYNNMRNLTYTFNEGKTYSVSLTLQTDKGCTETVTKNLDVQKVFAFAGNDTILARGQTMEMKGQGGTVYLWSPPEGLSNPNISNPVLTSNIDRTYNLYVQNAAGCEGSDDINVKYYEGPEIYVPTAFTPNGDGVNDIFRFIPVGIIEYKFFRIFNRWGQEIYSSVDFRKGWDGTFKGNPAKMDTYVWVVEGTDLNGAKVLRKGTVTLLR